MIRKIRNNQIIVAVVVVFALLGTLLPGYILVWQSKEQVNMVAEVPVEYYSPANLAVARNASANLGTYQKMQLITGRWESNVGSTLPGENEMADYDAALLAKQQMDALYREGLYPVSLLSDYGNWYNWEAEFCKVLDATFNTYAAYYWKFTFAKYDGSQEHHVYMLEDGTILLAEARMEDVAKTGELTKLSEQGSIWRVDGMEISAHKLSWKGQQPETYLNFADVDAEGLEWMDLVQLRVGERSYYGLQFYSDDRYLYSLQPMD